MNIFDIIGPVMVGPSSSHTAGAVRIGRMARMILGEDIREAHVRLHGSFAKTAVGHGTDRALVGGLLGYDVDDERIKDSLKLARDQGLTVVLEPADLGEVHPNTAKINMTGISGKKAEVTGASVGGGNIRIQGINGVTVSISGEYYTLVVSHRDLPGMAAHVTQILAGAGINIAFMRVYRSEKRGAAIMVIETDDAISEETAAQILNNPQVEGATVVRPV